MTDREARDIARNEKKNTPSPRKKSQRKFCCNPLIEIFVYLIYKAATRGCCLTIEPGKSPGKVWKFEQKQ